MESRSRKRRCDRAFSSPHARARLWPARLAFSFAAQFPATDDSLTEARSAANDSFVTSLRVDPGNLAAHSPNVATSAVAQLLSWPAAQTHATTVELRPNSYSENPNKWQLGVAFALVRFRSSVYYASAPGFNTSLAYWWKDWVGIEGSITSAFAPPVFENEHFRYLGYGAGPKFSFGQGRLQPWAHALVGGAHLIPQTASSGKARTDSEKSRWAAESTT